MRTPRISHFSDAPFSPAPGFAHHPPPPPAFASPAPLPPLPPILAAVREQPNLEMNGHLGDAGGPPAPPPLLHLPEGPFSPV